MTKIHKSIEDLMAETKDLSDKESETAKLKEEISEINLKDLEESAKKQAQVLNIPYINLVGFPIQPESLVLINEESARKLSAVCFYADQDNLRIGAINPTDPAVLSKLEELKERQHTPNAEIYLLSEHSLKRALDIYETLPIFKPIPPGMEIKEEDLEKYKEEIKDLAELNEKLKQINISEIMTLIIAGALKVNSSDVHVEAEKEGIIVRYRLDGVLREAGRMEKERWQRIISRFKALAKVKINVNDKPQDGRFTIFLQNQESKIDVRVSFLPTAYGESVVLRLLNSQTTGLDLSALGLRADELEKLEKEANKPNGLILVVGPTGSGKTTTLYAILKKLNKPGSKIVTIEDPVEYSLEGINQSQVDNAKGHTFAKALRSILRQDPDIIMVGEVRDLETAEIAIQSSLTGHLVLSTLHTNDSAGVIPRLLDIGVKPFLLTPSLNAIVGQRLVRKLCQHCSKEHKLSESEKEQVEKILAIIPPKADIDIPSELPTFYQPGEGCEYCHGQGYKGRLGIFEILTITSGIKEIANQSAPSFKILEQAIEEGMVTMLQDGILKAMDGTTSLEEVYKVIGKTDYVDALYDIATSKTIGRGLKISEENWKMSEEMAKDFSKSMSLMSNYKTSEIINILAGSAILAEASDIHIEPEEKGVNIRLRIDGILHDIGKIGKEHYVPLLNEIKNLSGLAVNAKQAVFDGRFAIYLPDKRRIDCRVSIISGGYGQTAVLRILAQETQTLKLEELGMGRKTLDDVLSAVSKTRGLIINTGPTGSGKTTTLYALLNKLNKPDVKIITIEDPIEYTLSGIMQTQIDEKSDYTFSTALRSLMRQNPNILMIGEIRDNQTAKTALESALTGHLVLSTVHANSSAGAVARLVELGLENELTADALECSIGQRLVRKLCPHCRQEEIPDQETLDKIKKILSSINPEQSKIILPTEFIFYKSVGCEQCGGIGYKGRIGLFEAINNTAEIKKMIFNKQIIEEDLEAEAFKQGFVSVLQDGILKALEGQTSLDEIFRVAE